MIVKGIIDEDFVNYKEASMTIEFPRCTFKCDIERGERVCQNGALASSPDIEIGIDKIVKRYINNPITNAIVFQGLEPFDSFEDVYELVSAFREVTSDDIVIYTGFIESEIMNYIKALEKYENIIIKFGRYIPGNKPHYDKVLGVNLASDNQYARKIWTKK